jgi:hypothetical protein
MMPPGTKPTPRSVIRRRSSYHIRARFRQIRDSRFSAPFPPSPRFQTPLRARGLPRASRKRRTRGLTGLPDVPRTFFPKPKMRQTDTLFGSSANPLAGGRCRLHGGKSTRAAREPAVPLWKDEVVVTTPLGRPSWDSAMRPSCGAKRPKTTVQLRNCGTSMVTV